MKGIDNPFNRIIAEKFLTTHMQEASRTPNHQDQKGNTPRHIIIKTLNTLNKERILKAAKEKRKVT
jgi:hypothetical protein